MWLIAVAQNIGFDIKPNLTLDDENQSGMFVANILKIIKR